MNIPERIRQWESDGGVELFRAVGVREGSVVLDFGFGHGHFAVAAARAAGRTGLVHALDCAPDSIDALKKRVLEDGIANLIVADTRGDVAIPLADASVDVVLCYDLLHHPGFDVSGLLAEAHRVLRPGGALSVAPFHMNGEAISALTAKIEAAGFGPPISIPDAAPHFGMLYSAFQGYAGADFDSVGKGAVYNFLKA